MSWGHYFHITFSDQYTMKLDMYLWNTDAPGSNKVKIWQKISKSYILTLPHPTPVACDVSEVWGTHRWTNNPSYFIITQTLNIALFLQAGRNYGQTYKQSDRQTDDPITRCPRGTFQAGGIKICENYPIQIFWNLQSTIMHNLVPDLIVFILCLGQHL